MTTAERIANYEQRLAEVRSQLRQLADLEQRLIGAIVALREVAQEEPARQNGAGVKER